jgi:hypothetical protein
MDIAAPILDGATLDGASRLLYNFCPVWCATHPGALPAPVQHPSLSPLGTYMLRNLVITTHAMLRPVETLTIMISS